MISKTFEIRDTDTFIPVLATKLLPGNEKDRYLIARSGYGTDPIAQGCYIFIAKINVGIGLSTSDPWAWVGSSRTMKVAHQYIRENFDILESGAVIDVEHILGETTSSKISEQQYAKQFL